MSSNQPESPMPRTRRTLLHASDMHLDNNLNLEQPTAPQRGLSRIVDDALKSDVDLVLIAGDLFDHNRVKEEVIEFACAELSRLNCPVVMISGNHDCYTEQSVYHRMDLNSIATDIHLLSEERGERLHLKELGMAFWGRGVIDHHPGHRPLVEVPSRDNGDWHIGLAHGYFDQRGATAFSSLISAEDIACADFDYLALGHVHVYSEVTQGSTRAAYSGSPNYSQGSRPGSYALVTLDPDAGITILQVETSC